MRVSVRGETQAEGECESEGAEVIGDGVLGCVSCCDGWWWRQTCGLW